jgi:diguanylate cyclase (GGDEF)-like protein
VGDGISKVEVDGANGEGSFFGEGASVDLLGWQVLALQNRSEISGPIQNALEKVLLASAVVVAFTIIASLLISREVTRPVRSLIAGMQNVAEGSFEQRVPRGNLKETRALAGAFNRMASNLEESRMRLESAHRELEQRFEELAHARRQAATDSLTGLHNHRWLQEKLQKEVKRSLRYGHPFAVLLMDVNGFRLFNETYGHATGDSVLRQTAKLLAATCGKGSFVGRYGGDDFMAILPNTDREGALDIANRIIDAVSASPVRVANGNELPLALSIGLATCPEDSQHREEMLAIADASLHQAKQTSGSNVAEGQTQQSTLVVYKDTPFRLFDSLVHAVDVKDRYTHSHSQQNAEYAVALGKALDLSEVTLAALRIAGLLHDIGKIGVPDDILMKPGPLTSEEQATMRRHVILSKLIVHGVPNLQDVSDAVYSHHERWDGAGYPRGLRGEEISVAGRIMALVDAYSAMILDRPYRKAMSRAQAIAELEKNAGTQFDPELVSLFVSVLRADETEAA